MNYEQLLSYVNCNVFIWEDLDVTILMSKLKNTISELIITIYKIKMPITWYSYGAEIQRGTVPIRGF